MEQNFQSKGLPNETRIESQDLPGGKRVVRRYEHSVLVTEMHFETVASGKQIRREFDRNMNLTRENHSYGTLDIAIERRFGDGRQTFETYFVKRKLASRRSYEKARLKYRDMPSADPTLEDFGAGLLKDLASERKALAAARKSHLPDPKGARKKDSFCRHLMANGTFADAQKWIKARNHTLGEMDHNASRRLVERMARLGAVHVFACEIDDYDGRGQNTGHVVVELPKGKASRFKFFAGMARIAESYGFAGDLDDGQKYAYLKLD
jgi:hypothetical protein